MRIHMKAIILSILGCSLIGNSCLCGNRDLAWMMLGNSSSFFQVYISPNGKYVLSVEPQTAKLCSVGKGTLLKTIPFSLGFTSTPPFAFSPDGEMLYYGDSARIRCLNIGLDSLVNTYSGHSRAIYSLGISSDGNTLISGGDDSTCIVWDLRTATPQARVIKFSERVGRVGFTGGDRFIYSVGYKWITIMDRQSGSTIHTFPCGPFAVSPADTIIALANPRVPGTISISQIAILTLSGRRVSTHSFPQGEWVRSFTLTQGGRYLVTSHSRQLRVYSTRRGDLLRTVRADLGNALAVSPDERLIAAGVDYSDEQVRREGSMYVKRIGVWDLLTGEPKGMLSAPMDLSSPLAFSANSVNLLTGDDRNGLKLWDVQSCQLLQTFTHHASHITDIACSRGLNISASLSEDGTIFVWESATGKALWSLTLEYLQGRTLTFTPDGNFLVSSGYHVAENDSSERPNDYKIDSLKLFILDGLTGKKVSQRSLACTNIVTTTISPDSNQVLISSDSGLQAWDLSTGLLTKPRSFDRYERGAYSPKADYLLIAEGEGGFRVVDLKTGHVLLNTQAHRGFTRTISWSLDEKLLVTTGQDDNTLKVWEIPGRRLAKTISLDVPQVHYGSVSPSGKYFAGSGKNGIVTIWDLESGNRIRSYLENPTYIWSIAWSADEAFVYAGHNDGTIVAWRTGVHP